MVRQYIGARYVTKVYENSLDPSSAEWEAGVTYEPLTMVTYLNSSYLSKKPVPASIGDPAANPSYWVVTGAYNGQILALDNRITAIENDYVKQNTLVVFCEDIGVLPTNTGAQNSQALNDWIDAHNTEYFTILFGADTYTFEDGIKISYGTNLMGNSNGSILVFESGANSCFYLPAEVNDPNEAWKYKNNHFSNLAIHNHTNSVENRTVFDFGLETDPSLINIHNMLFENIYIQYFAKGFYVEGYGHTFIGCYVNHSDVSFDLVHPEQVTMIDCWANYSATAGLQTNVTKNGMYGSGFTVIGGAFQRGSSVGMILRELRNVNINTYFELNVDADIVVGLSTGSYSDSCKQLDFTITTESTQKAATTPNVQLYHAECGEITVFNAASGAYLLEANGYSKGIILNTVTPGQTYDFQGNSAKYSHAIETDTEVYTGYGQTLRQLDYVTDHVIEHVIYSGKYALEYALTNSKFMVTGDATSSMIFALNSRNELVVENNKITHDVNTTVFKSNTAGTSGELSLIDSNNSGTSIRFNTGTNKLQVYFGGSWHDVAFDN